METLIIICLLLVVFLLLQDKIIIHRKEKPEQEKTNPELPDIMGQPKPLRSLSIPKSACERQSKEQEQQNDNFDNEISEEDFNLKNPQEEPEDFIRNKPDLEEEEEEWNRYGIYSGNDGFAQGVTFEELSSVGMLLRKENLEPSQKETAISIVKKIQGTELFNMLENSIEGVSRKIAELLDGSLSVEGNPGSSELRRNDLNNFDIGDFI